MPIKSFKIYTIDVHPQPSNVYKWCRENWTDLADFVFEEAKDSIKAFSDHFDLTFASQLRHQQPWLHFNTKTELLCLHGEGLTNYLNSRNMLPKEFLAEHNPLTGTKFDESLIKAIRDRSPQDTFNHILRTAGKNLIAEVAKEYDNYYSDDGLKFICETNGYYFTRSGKRVL